MHAIEDLIAFAGSIALAILPRTFRSRWFPGFGDIGRGALAFGLIEMILGIALFITRFLGIAPHSGLTPLPVDLGRAGGFLTMINAAFDPLNVLFMFAFLEGLVRALAALTGEVLPILPLQLVAWLTSEVAGHRSRKALGPFVEDEVDIVDGDDTNLVVRSRLRKSHWHPYVSIRYRGGFYGVVGAEHRSPPRPFVYYLRKRQENELVVVVYAYDPREGAIPNAAPSRWVPPTC